MAADLFRASHAEAGDEVAPGFSGAAGGSLGLFGAEMADAGDDALERDAHGAFGLVGGLLNRVEVFAPCGEIAAAAEIGREEGFRIDDAVFSALLQHGEGQPAEVVGALQRGAGGLVDLQEMVEILVGVAAVFIEDAADVDGFFLGQTGDEGGRRAPFEVEVKFDLGECFPAHRNDFPGGWEGMFRCAAMVAATSANAMWPSAREPRPWMRTGTRSRV